MTTKTESTTDVLSLKFAPGTDDLDATESPVARLFEKIGREN